MIIHINGNEERVESGISIAALIKERGLNPEHLVVEHNRSIVRREDWDTTELGENDSIELLSFVGGG
jgi:thiamine biosynthesis protein ThiS